MPTTPILSCNLHFNSSITNTHTHSFNSSTVVGSLVKPADQECFASSLCLFFAFLHALAHFTHSLPVLADVTRRWRHRVCCCRHRRPTVQTVRPEAIHTVHRPSIFKDYPSRVWTVRSTVLRPIPLSNLPEHLLYSLDQRLRVGLFS